MMEKKERGNRLVWGVLLVAVGIVLYLRSMGWIGLTFNWWALFILMPVAGLLAAAGAAIRQAGGRLNSAARGSLGSAAIILTVAILLMFGFDWGIWWPLMLLVPGLSTLLTSFAPLEMKQPSLTRYLNPGVWLGLGMIYLGGGFLLNNLDLVDLQALTNPLAWWGFAILIPGVGALINAAILFLEKGLRAGIQVIGLAGAGLLICLVAGFALFGLNWSLLWPFILIAIGFLVLASALQPRPSPETEPPDSES
jgi:hypothetical protein